jgi:hypothetical protein
MSLTDVNASRLGDTVRQALGPCLEALSQDLHQVLCEEFTRQLHYIEERVDFDSLRFTEYSAPCFADTFKAKLKDGTLTFAPILEMTPIPSNGGVYAFVEHGKAEPLYVGGTSNLKMRLNRGHHAISDAYKSGARGVVFLAVPGNLVKAVERLLIDHYAPPVNAVVPNTPDIEGAIEEITIPLNEDVAAGLFAYCKVMQDSPAPLLNRWIASQLRSKGYLNADNALTQKAMKQLSSREKAA